MPRRRAVRVIGASLAALTVPGVTPRIGAASNLQAKCPPNSGRSQCRTQDDLPPGVPQREYCCPFPAQQWGCGDKDNGYQCRNGCPRWNPVIEKNQKPCWSSEKLPDGSPKHYNCCLFPDQICDPSDINLCVPNCRLQYPGLGYVQCGRQCCPPGSVCRVVDGKKKCVECANTCKPPRGRAICCERGEQCCFNNTTAACCGPKQTCKASNVKQATCVCEKGRKCGSDCCKKGETCCRGKQCCATGETCTSTGCCPSSALCPQLAGGPACCDADEYCLFRIDPSDETAPLTAVGTCKRGCAPGNRAGRQCCGTGYKPNRRRTRCVRA